MLILARGAEAVLRKEDDIVFKERVAKDYRIPQLDYPLRKSRTRREAKILDKLSKSGVLVPKLLSCDDTNMIISMEFIDGPRLRDQLAEASEQYGRELGHIIGIMHAQDIIHGDLTTSNVLVSEKKLIMIDFGLSFFSKKDEDKAVDLHVLHQTLVAHHNNLSDLVWHAVMEGYANSYTSANIVLKRLEKVELRGRNKTK